MQATLINNPNIRTLQFEKNRPQAGCVFQQKPVRINLLALKIQCKLMPAACNDTKLNNGLNAFCCANDNSI